LFSLAFKDISFAEFLLAQLNKTLMSSNWWRDAVIYQVYPRSFRDSNGDGEGDLQGVIQGLPYLESLGVDAIWLSPFYKSPNKDGGYDVADPRDVDPRFGTLDDAKELIKSAHSHGIKVIFDIVPNHFSSEHKWFIEALNSAPGSKERARFHFYDGKGDGSTPPNNWPSIFTGSCWTRINEKDGKPGQWYLHLFDSSQPDLNWSNQDIADDFEKTLRFWLDMGIDGFRIDVAHGLAKDEIKKDHHDPEGLALALRIDDVSMDKERRISLLSDIPFFDRAGVHEIYRKWRKVLDEYPDKMAVAEAFIYPTSKLVKYIRKDELHQVFNFDFLLIEWDAKVIRECVERVIAEVSVEGAPATWCLNNHDSKRLVSRLGDSEKAKALALLTQALPGSIYIYEGEELGLPDGQMPDNARQDPLYFRSKGADLGRDGCRVPIPWQANEKNFGFTTGTPWLPMMNEYKDFAIDEEEQDKDSYLNLYKRSLKLRKSIVGLQGNSTIQFQDIKPGIVHFTRMNGFHLYANTNENPINIENVSGEVILKSNSGISISNGTLTLPANSTVWIQA
jgi:alpha-glucosidase